ncbi:MAG: Pr6Pr family membrane protein [Pseudomonadota bacterium]
MYLTVGAVAALALIGQLILRVTAPEADGLLGELWHMVHFFTIWTNALVAVVFLRAAAGRPPSASLAGGLTVWIAVVGLIYWLLLYRGLPPSDPEFYTDHAFHTVVPIAVVLWWVLKAPRAVLGVKDAALWLVFPIGYLGYALLRGAVTGGYPYPFMDVSALGYTGALLNVSGVAALFFVLGLGLVGISRLRAR